jgi:hypothetical protein
MARRRLARKGKSMNANSKILNQLFSSLDRHDHQAMADCYDREATFRDIAFDLRGKTQVHAMWHMICETDIRTTFDLGQVDEQNGEVNVVDEYTFSSTGRKVRNVIRSQFRFRNGLIIEEQDLCDARLWAAMALGGVAGFLAGRFRFLRSLKARKMLRAFIERHPEYQ